MPTSTFTHTTSKNRFVPRTGDYVCLPYINESTAAFPATLFDVSTEDIPGEKGVSRIVTANASGALLRVFRLDAEERTTERNAKSMMRTALEEAQKQGCKRVTICLDAKHTSLILAVQEGALLGGYRYERYLSKTKKPLPVVCITNDRKNTDLKKQCTQQAITCECVNFARDILNGPPNEIHPVSLAKILGKTGKAAGLRMSVWDDKRCQRERCGGLLGVGQGAKQKPRMVIGEYAPRGAKAHLALVGKGITFDTGGYSIKTSAGMEGMKYDMGGAAMMFAAACAIARQKLPIRCTVITPLAENDISGESYHVQSVLTTRSGKTVEVMNTDAEGRLVLTDGLTLAKEKKPDYIIDAATLTGACMVGLGADIAGAYGTDPAFTQQLLQAGADAGEDFWELPLHKAYAKELRSTIADTKNLGGKYGGSIHGALFLRQWVDDKQKWIHLDIAGPGTKEDAFEHLGKGAKGFGVKTIVALAARLGQ